MSVERTQARGDLLLESLNKFYSNKDNLRKFTDIRKSKISLRIFDFVVINFAKKYNVTYPLVRDGNTEIFNMYLEYKSQLKSFQKRYFDPFCRRDRIEFVNADGEVMMTTVGQLTFFRWAIINKVYDYTVENLKTIEKDMVETTSAVSNKIVESVKQEMNIQNNKASTSGSDSDSRRRKEISRAALKSFTNTKMVVTVRFT